MQAKLTEIVDIVGHDPAVANVVGFTGGRATGPSTATNTARLFVMLKPLAERKVSADQVIAGCAGALPGCRAPPPSSRRCRMFARVAARGTRSTSTRCRGTTSASSTRGDRGSRSASARCRSSSI
jgi:multidrug efflux pump subunit AcrB